MEEKKNCHVVICTNQLPNSVWDCFLLQRKMLQREKEERNFVYDYISGKGNNYLYWMQSVSLCRFDAVFMRCVLPEKGFKHDFTGFDMYVNINEIEKTLPFYDLAIWCK